MSTIRITPARVAEAIVVLLLALAINAMLFVAWTAPAHAAPVAVLTADDGHVVLTDEPCTMPDQVANLPYRATWSQGGKTQEGCYSVFGGSVIVGYFADHTVAVMPASMFVRASGA